MVQTRAKKSSQKPIVVAIGASAGGHRALKSVFSKISSSKNFCFLVVQHLDASGKNLTLESLKKITDFKVQELKAGIALLPGTVYLVPPHTTVSFKSHKVHLAGARSTTAKLAVIDHLFEAVGKEYGESSVGVVLSGEASDGAQGVRILNGRGGLTMAQQPQTADHSSMPESAIATGCIDHVLSPLEISKALESYAKYITPDKIDPKKSAFKDQIVSALTSICEVLHQKTKHDFKHYKTSTLVRRIQRRMQVLQISAVDDYLDQLKGTSDEYHILFNELLINVTSFFRDKDAFEALQNEVLKPLVAARKPNQKIRIWVSGCSTGEEPYSMAILIRELIDKLKDPPEVQIIATDIDDAALAIARRGVYPATIAEHVSAERLAKFFIKRAGKYHVNKDLREMCLFSVHNLITDPPFSQLDLISCRNVIIYLGPHLQQKLFPVFHYALKPGGYLFLGASETVASHKELFNSIDAKLRIAQRKVTAIKMPPITGSVQNYLSHFQESQKVTEADLNLIGQRIALDEMPLRYAIVNDEGQILSASAGLHKYVQVPEGTFHNNIIKLVASSLRAGLRTVFKAARKEKRKVTNDTCTIKLEGGVERTAVIVQPMPQLGDTSELYWVAFQNMGMLRDQKVENIKSFTEADVELVDQLELELGMVRQELDKTVQDLEASNEELKSSNEELLSMNEELQSSNEELEASKEEVQVTNEALQRINSDLENLLASTEIATLFLDDELVIQNFTPELTSIYNVSKVDVGRPITDITTRAQKMIPLPKREEVIAKKVIEDDLEFQDGRRILRRVTPYRVAEGSYSGIVVTFIDVTHLRVAENLRQESEKRFEIMADTAPVLVWISGRDRKRTWFNRGWVEFTGQTIAESFGESWKKSVHPEDLERYVQIYNTHFESRSPFHIEYRLKHVSGVYRWISARGVPRFSPDGTFEGFIGACLDIHEQKAAREELRISQERYQTLTEVIPQLVWTCLPDGRCDYLSRQWEEYTGIPASDQLDFNWLDRVIHPNDRERTAKHWQGAVQGLHSYDIDYRIRKHDGEYRWFQTRGTPIRDSQGKISRWFGTCTDINDLKQAQDHVSSSEKRLEMMIRTSPSFMCLLSGPNFIFEQVNEHYLMLVGHRDIIGKSVLEALPEVKGQGFIERLQKVQETGEPYIGREIPFLLQRTPGGPTEKRFLDFVYQPADMIDGKVEGIFVHGVDVTDKVDARAVIENERENFRNLFKQTPEMVCILSGPEHLFNFVNEAHIRLLGFDATGKTVREAQPESTEVHGILDGVYQRGITAELHEIPVTVGSRLRYFNLTYAGRRNLSGEIDGVMILGTEVTEQVLYRESVRFQKDALEHALNGAPLSTVLEFLARMVEFQVGGNIIASILLADKEGQRLLHGAAPNLPKEFCDAINGVQIGPRIGSCGTAAYFKKTIVVENIKTDDLWSDFQDLANMAGVSACWSSPILTSSGKLLGTFAIYAKNPRKPSAREIETVELAGHAAALIIERQSEITERIESQERLQFALSSAKMGTWEVLFPSQKVSLSEEARAIFGTGKNYGSTDVAIDDFIHPDDRDHARSVLTKSLENNEPYQDEYRIVRPSGEVRWTHVRGRAHLTNGQPDRLTGIVMDIHAQKVAEIELHEAKQEAEIARVIAESASESKTRFLANMSHEIRTPLAAVIGFTDILRQELPANEAAHGYFERISRNANQLRRLIDELLDLSKIEADKLEIHESVVNVDSLIEDVLSTVLLRAQDKGLAVNFKWISEKPREIETDQVRLVQILNNIIGNAIKFTDSGSVDVEFGVKDDKFIIRVSDTGIGLTEEQQRRIFEPFVQADASITRKYGGTGLGLALSKRLANRLGGDLVLESSELHKGTVFKISVRFRSQKATYGIGVAEAGLRSAPLDPEKILLGKKILLVDDAPDNRVLVAHYLRPFDIVLSEAANGLEAIEKARLESYDLVLMDIQMPIMDGHQAAETLIQSGYRVPIVALTAHAMKDEKERCMESGFAGYLTKPITRQSLISCILENLRN